ncbi:hypothetical protein FGRMN_143 [Fusarium graminum]|nr:hypothetical protein FGRMN_143 [Fusarium graminum]
MLLREVATGPDQFRGLVLEYMDAGKQPLDILRSLKSSEEVDLQSLQGSSSSSTSPPQAFDMQGTIPFGTSSSFTQPEGTLHDGRYYSTMDSMTVSLSFGQSSALRQSMSRPCVDSNGSIPGYTVIKQPSIDTTQSYGIGPSEVARSNLMIVPSTEGLLSDLPQSHSSNIQQEPSSNQIRKRSLFFEPLFDHTDYYLATPTSKPLQQHGMANSQGTMTFQDTQAFLPPEQLLGTTDTTIDHFNASSQEDAIAREQTNQQTPQASHRIDPNYKNHFNNLSLSSSIRANGFPRQVQDAQIRNIFVPNWAVTSLNTEPDPGGLEDAFGDIYRKATGLLKKGEPAYRIVGSHPNIAALYDQAEFDKSCLLSQWAARMVQSVKLKGYDFTCFASMNVFWYVMRWMISPSPDTYAAMPEWIRPTSSQIFTPHISMADFVLWPDFRNLVVQLPQLQERMAWLADMSASIRCEWPYDLEQALRRDPVSGEQHVWTLGYWSVGPSFRTFVSNADSYLQVRPEEAEVTQ